MVIRVVRPLFVPTDFAADAGRQHGLHAALYGLQIHGPIHELLSAAVDGLQTNLDLGEVRLAQQIG